MKLALSILAGAATVAATAGAPTTGAHAAAKAKVMAYDPHDISGVWVQQDKAPRFRTLLPYTPEYAKMLKQRLDGLAAGRPYRHDGGACLPSGIIGVMTGGGPTYPLQIVQMGKREVLMTMESSDITFHIHLDRGHKPLDEQTPHYFGDNVARWEGNTLVVDSIDLGKMDSLGDQVSPSSPDMHVTQRFTRTSFDILEDQITMDDPKALTKPYSLTIHYKLDPKGELDEVTCDNERLLFDAQGDTHVLPAK